MKSKDLISQFTIALSNEENTVLEKMSGLTPIHFYNEREQFVIESLIRKSLVSKVHYKGSVLVIANE